MIPREVQERLVIVMGRGHSGTRVAAHLLQNAGVALVGPLNGSMDTTPKPNPMYEFARLAGHRVAWQLDDPPSYDFSRLILEDIPAEAVGLFEEWCSAVMETRPKPNGWRGWKLPETILAFPWVVRLLPHARYIWWLRDPRSCILRQHGTDDIRSWGVVTAEPGTPMQRRVWSWLYQEAIVLQTPQPGHLLKLTFEAWADNQQPTLEALAEFLPGTEPRAHGLDPAPVRRHDREGGQLTANEKGAFEDAISRHWEAE